MYIIIINKRLVLLKLHFLSEKLNFLYKKSLDDEAQSIQRHNELLKVLGQLRPVFHSSDADNGTVLHDLSSFGFKPPFEEHEIFLQFENDLESNPDLQTAVVNDSIMHTCAIFQCNLQMSQFIHIFINGEKR